MDALQRTGRRRPRAASGGCPVVLIGPDGGTGFRPGLPHALGYSGRNDPARDGFRGNAQGFREPPVDSGGGVRPGHGPRVKSVPAAAASTASRQASRPPARNSWATASSPCTGRATAASGPEPVAAACCGSHSPVTQPSVAGTSEVCAADRAAPTSTSGLRPAESTRKNFTMAAESPSSTITELLDCSPERTLTVPAALGSGWPRAREVPAGRPARGDSLRCA